MKFSHNSTLAEDEPQWSDIDKTKLPRQAFCFDAPDTDPDKKSTWKFPHHWVQGGGDLDDNSVYTTGTMYLHRGGLNAAWAMAMGARSGVVADPKIIAHLKKHRDALGIGEEKDDLVMAFKEVNEEAQVVYGVVYTPNRVDTDWETMTAEELQRAAWDFLATGKFQKIDIQHSLQESGSEVVESFIAREGDPDFPEGSWVLGVRCPDEVWQGIKDGSLNGFSFYATVSKYPATVLVEVAKQIAGITETSTIDIIPPHEHTFIVNLNNKGGIVSGKTDIVMEHSHVIMKGTATEKALDHNHRIFLE